MTRALWTIAFVLLCALVPLTRVVWSSHSELRQADSSTGAERIFHLGMAARLYAPGNPFSARALDALAAEGRSGSVLSFDAWQAVRSAILATRSFYTPHPALLAEANEQLALILADRDDAHRGSLDERRQFHRERLALDEAPSVGWTLLALFGLVAWVGSAYWFFSRGLDGGERLRLRRGPAVLCGLGVVVGLILFVIGLARA